jgi:hypothetical protein
MKRTSPESKGSRNEAADEILAEYSFRGVTRKKYASRYAAGSTVIVLEPDVAAAFPTSAEANDALRASATLIERHRTKRPAQRGGWLRRRLRHGTERDR